MQQRKSVSYSASCENIPNHLDGNDEWVVGDHVKSNGDTLTTGATSAISTSSKPSKEKAEDGEVQYSMDYFAEAARQATTWRRNYALSKNELDTSQNSRKASFSGSRYSELNSSRHSELSCSRHSEASRYGSDLDSSKHGKPSFRNHTATRSSLRVIDTTAVDSNDSTERSRRIRYSSLFDKRNKSVGCLQTDLPSIFDNNISDYQVINRARIHNHGESSSPLRVRSDHAGIGNISVSASVGEKQADVLRTRNWIKRYSSFSGTSNNVSNGIGNSSNGFTSNTRSISPTLIAAASNTAATSIPSSAVTIPFDASMVMAATDGGVPRSTTSMKSLSSASVNARTCTEDTLDCSLNSAINNNNTYKAASFVRDPRKTSQFRPNGLNAQMEVALLNTIQRGADAGVGAKSSAAATDDLTTNRSKESGRAPKAQSCADQLTSPTSRLARAGYQISC